MAKKLTEEDFEKALFEVLDKNDDVIVIYSAIWSFAHRFDGKTEEITKRIFDVIDSVVGKDRTILFPTFTNSFVKTRRFDLVLDESDCSGVIANYALRSPGFKRTKQPIHSYVVKGPRADEVLARQCTTAWGDDSVIAWMGEVDARFCPLGLPWHYACSYFHRIEEILQVPYRYYKRFAGDLLENGEKKGTCVEVKFSNSLSFRPEFDYTIVRSRLEEMGAIQKSANPLIPLQSGKANAIGKATHELLGNDIYAYVKNRDAVDAWVNNGKAEEIASLNDDECWPPKS